jgi:hypothetical protein
MIDPSHIVPGAIVRHDRTGDYLIQKFVEMRLPDGKWVKAVLYTEFHISNGRDYVRPVTDFGDTFTLVARERYPD